jgi:DNA-binding PadR family transcriptional regulator
MEERSHGFYTPSPGAVYPTLQFLEETGYVEAAQHDGKKIYSITDEGRKFLTERRQFADGIKKQMRDRWGTRDMGEMRETMAEVGKLGRLLGRHFRSLDAQKTQRIKEVITRAYKDIEMILEQ